uniref:LSM domain-containing protein n=2 Tax=Propithecus coquereli TaxID=379532 RepID=A0A2K6EE89_PROCO
MGSGARELKFRVGGRGVAAEAASGGAEITPEGRRITKLDQILLNGNNITMLVPGGEGPEV